MSETKKPDVKAEDEAQLAREVVGLLDEAKALVGAGHYSAAWGVVQAARDLIRDDLGAFVHAGCPECGTGDDEA